MTRLILEIPRAQDLPRLLAFCKRLNIRILDPGPAASVPPSDRTEDLRLIMAGLPERPDLDSWLQAFEASRSDRPMPR